MVEVSVITVVKEDASGLLKTHSSLASQTFSNWEMIVVVGSSQDGTLTVAKNLEAIDSRIRVSEQVGEGIYKAMNEGIQLALGNFTWFMNAGDSFFSTTILSHAVNEISKDSVSIVIGGYQTFGDNLKETYTYSKQEITPRDLAFTRRGGCHQAMIFRTQFLQDHGGFNTSYSLASDFDLVLRILGSAPGKRVSEVYASIEPGGRADKGILQVHREKHQIRQALFGGPLMLCLSLIWTQMARIKITLRSILHR
jgi:glycosyltransferase involved in cell wall biosynthesis